MDQTNFRLVRSYFTRRVVQAFGKSSGPFKPLEGDDSGILAERLGESHQEIRLRPLGSLQESVSLLQKFLIFLKIHKIIHILGSQDPIQIASTSGRIPSDQIVIRRVENDGMKPQFHRAESLAQELGGAPNGLSVDQSDFRGLMSAEIRESEDDFELGFPHIPIFTWG